MSGRARRRTRPYAAALALSAVVVLPACHRSGGDAPEPTAAQRLTAAKKVMDSSPSVHVVIDSPDFPDRGEGVSAADGVATHQPGFKGTLTVRAKGLSGKVDVVSVGGKLHLRLPFTRSYVEAKASDYDAPDPAQLLSPDKGISSLLTRTRQPALGDKKRDGTAVVQTVTGTIPGDAVVDVLATGNRAGTFRATYAIDDSDHLRSVHLSGPFFTYAAPTTTYDVTLDRYGDKVTVGAP